MIEKYKLTDSDGCTRNGTKWEIGRTNAVLPALRRPKLCSDGVLHAYHHPLVAVLLNPIHAAFRNPRMFKVECSDVIADDGLKCGTYEQTPIAEMDVPRPTAECRACFAILCAWQVCHDETWRRWAMNYLDGTDRSAAAAADAAAADAAAYAAADAAAYAAAYAAYAAAYAAYAAYAAAYAAADAAAADAAAAAADAAAYAADAADAEQKLDFGSLAEQALALASEDA